MAFNAIVAGGLDPSGGAGLSSDIKTCSRFGVYPLPIITALTYQNYSEFYGFKPLEKEEIEKQLKSVLGFYSVEFAKIGLVGNAENLDLLIWTLNKNGIKTVLDPVLKTSTGGEVCDKNYIESIKNAGERIYLITPNIPEAKMLTGEKTDNPDILGKTLLSEKFENILVKGGHRQDNADDILFSKEKKIVLKGKRIDTLNTRGTGCALSSAIVSLLASGHSVEKACELSKRYIEKAMIQGIKTGKPPYPLNLCLK